MKTKEFWFDLLERCIATFAEAMLGFMTVGMALRDIDWLQALSVSALATMITIAKCFIKLRPSESIHIEDYSDIDKSTEP